MEMTRRGIMKKRHWRYCKQIYSNVDDTHDKARGIWILIYKLLYMKKHRS